MADSGFAGLYVKLKDRARPLPDRLKLIRFAWKCPEVFIPNKEQVLTDILCGLLLNQKKNQVSEDEVVQVWECLWEVLHCHQVVTQSESCPLVILRQYMPQLMMDYLQKAEGFREEGMSAVIRCAQVVMESPSLSVIFTAKLETMVHLLCVLCGTLKQDHQRLEVLTEALIDCTVDRYTRALKTSPNQTQTLKYCCDKYLPQLVSLWPKLEGSLIGQKLSSVFLTTAMHKDHQRSYEEFLSAWSSPAGDLKLHRKSKGVDHLFTCLNQLMQQDKDVAGALAQYLPVLFDGFILHNCHNNKPVTAHLLVMKLCQLVGIGIEEPSSNLQGYVDVDRVVGLVSRLLQLVQSHDIYTIQSDDKTEGQVVFYRKLLQFLLRHFCARCDWFSCLTSMLQIDHTILEPCLKEVLLIGWVQVESQMPAPVNEALDWFLSQLLVTYTKLRQVTRLMTQILDALNFARDNNTVQLLPQFLKHYGMTTQDLPQTVLVDIWKMFVTCLHDNYLQGHGEGHFYDVCRLFYHYLMNVKVTDYSVTALTLKAVEELMVTMEIKILAPFLVRNLNDVDKKQIWQKQLLGTLHLCHAWGEVMTMLALYKSYRASSITSTAIVSHPGDLMFLHTYLDSKQWKALYKKLKKLENPSLTHAWELLCMQKVKAMMLFKETSDWSIIGTCVEDMFVLPSNLTEADSQMTWSGHVEDVTNNNQLVARWHLLLSNMAAVRCVLSHDYLQTVSRLLVLTGSTHQTQSPSDTIITLKSVSDEALLSPWLLDSASLLGHLVTAVWQRCCNCFSGNQLSPDKKKKRKHDEKTAAFLQVQNALSDTNTDWLSGVTEVTLTHIQMAGAQLRTLLSKADKEPGNMTGLDVQAVQSLLKLLQKLPLEHLGSCDQIRCLTGLLSVMAIVQTDKASTELWPLCLELCTVLLEVCGNTPVFQVIDLPTYLTWLHTCVQQAQQDAVKFNRCLLLLEMSVSTAVRDHQVLHTLPPFVEQLCLELGDASPHGRPQDLGLILLAVFTLQETTRMLNRSYLNESKKETCSLVYQQLSLSLTQFTPVLREPMFTPLEGAIVRAFTNVLAANFRIDQVKEVFMTSLPLLITWCKKALIQSQHEGGMFVVMSALYFLLTLARCHSHLAPMFDGEQKLLIWSVLLDVLRIQLVSENKSSNQGLYKEPQVPINSQNYYFLSMKMTSKKVKKDETKQIHSDRIKKMKIEEHASVKQVFDKKEDSLRFIDKIDALLNYDSRDVSVVKSQKRSRQCVFVVEQEMGDVIMELVPSPAVIVALYKSLAFQGKLETSGVKVKLMLLQTVMATLMTSMQPDDFGHIVHGLVNDVHTRSLVQAPGKIQTTLFIWRHLLTLEFSDEQTKVIRYAARILMVNMQSVQQQLCCHDDDRLVKEVTVPLLHTQQQMLACGMKFLPPQSVMMSLMSCMNTPLGGATYVPAFTAVCDILDCLLVHHTQTVFLNIPAYVGCAKRLLLSVVDQSDQENISHDLLVTKQLIGCAYQMERLFTLMSTHKVEFSKVALYVVADYVTAVQKVTVLPAVKRGLVPAVYRMLDLCDKHAVAQLHTILSHGVTEVFKVIYAEYTKFYKYSGKV